MVNPVHMDVPGRPSPVPDRQSRPRFLLSPPDYFDSHFLFNPWMKYEDRVDRRKARAQFRRLVSVLEEAGASLEFMEPSEESSAQVFTADGALVYAPGRALILRNDGPRGHFEPRMFSRWFQDCGYQTESLPPRYNLDGGNVLRLHDGTFLVGLKPFALGQSERYLARLMRLVCGARVLPMTLVDNRYLHLDMVVGRLGDRGYMVYRDGLYSAAQKVVDTLLSELEVIDVDSSDAMAFACNAITVGDVVITGPISKDLSRRISGLGFNVEELPLTEFYKAGGGAKCLTLPLI